MLLRHTFFALFIGISLLSTACKKDDEPSPEPKVQVILPGIGITDLKLGDPAQKAIDLFGSASTSSGSFGGQYTHFLTYFSKGVIVYCELTTEAK